MRSHIYHSVGLALVVLMAGAGPLSAQQDPVEVQRRNNCRLAEQILTLGQPANKRAWALHRIGSCPQAVDVLPALWASPPTGEGEIQQLYYASLHAKDPAVFDIALGVARDPAAPDLVRLAAFGTVVSYIRPSLILSLTDRAPFEGIPSVEWHVPWGTLSHPVHTEGEVNLPAGAAEAMLSLVQDLRADEDAPSLLRDAAFWLPELHDFPE